MSVYKETTVIENSVEAVPISKKTNYGEWKRGVDDASGMAKAWNSIKGFEAKPGLPTYMPSRMVKNEYQKASCAVWQRPYDESAADSNLPRDTFI